VPRHPGPPAARGAQPQQQGSCRSCARNACWRAGCAQRPAAVRAERGPKHTACRRQGLNAGRVQNAGMGLHAGWFQMQAGFICNG
jgi:hypothetical protein